MYQRMTSRVGRKRAIKPSAIEDDTGGQPSPCKRPKVVVEVVREETNTSTTDSKQAGSTKMMSSTASAASTSLASAVSAIAPPPDTHSSWMTLIRRLVSVSALEAPFTRHGPIRWDQWEGDATQWFWKRSTGHDDDSYDDHNPILGGLMRRWAADAKTKTVSPFDAKYWQTVGGNQDAETATLTRGYAPMLLAFFHEKYRVNKNHHGSFEFQVVWDAVCNVDHQRTSTDDGFGTSEQLIRDTGPVIGRAKNSGHDVSIVMALGILATMGVSPVRRFAGGGMILRFGDHLKHDLHLTVVVYHKKFAALARYFALQNAR